jgi:hypothetical protein
LVSRLDEAEGSTRELFACLLVFCLSLLRTSGADVLGFAVGLFATCFISDWPLLSVLLTSGADVLGFAVGLLVTCFTSDWPLLSLLLTSGADVRGLFLWVCRLISRAFVPLSELDGFTVLPLG